MGCRMPWRKPRRFASILASRSLRQDSRRELDAKSMVCHVEPAMKYATIKDTVTTIRAWTNGGKSGSRKNKSEKKRRHARTKLELKERRQRRRWKGNNEKHWQGKKHKRKTTQRRRRKQDWRRIN